MLGELVVELRHAARWQLATPHRPAGPVESLPSDAYLAGSLGDRAPLRYRHLGLP